METINLTKSSQKKKIEYEALKKLIQKKQEIRINFSRSQAYHLLQLRLQSQINGQLLSLAANSRPQNPIQQAQDIHLHKMKHFQSSSQSSTVSENMLLEVIRRQKNRLVGAGSRQEKPLMRSSVMSRTYRRKKHSQLSLRSNSCRESELVNKQKVFHTVDVGPGESFELGMGQARAPNFLKKPLPNNNFSPHLPVKHAYSTFLTPPSCQQEIQRFVTMNINDSLIQQRPVPYTSRRKRKSVNQAIPQIHQYLPQTKLLKQPQSACGPWKNHHDKDLKQQQHHLQEL